MWILNSSKFFPYHFTRFWWFSWFLVTLQKNCFSCFSLFLCWSFESWCFWGCLCVLWASLGVCFYDFWKIFLFRGCLSWQKFPWGWFSTSFVGFPFSFCVFLWAPCCFCCSFSLGLFSSRTDQWPVRDKYFPKKLGWGPVTATSYVFCCAHAAPNFVYILSSGSGSIEL